MSSQICIIKSPNRIAHSDMLHIKPFMPESLANYVARHMADKQISGYQIERVTKGSITQSYVNRIKNGEVLTPSTPKLQALAKGLGVPETELFAVARGVSPNASELAHERLQSIDFAYEGMPKKKKQKADYVIELLEREIKRIIDEPE